MICRLHVVRFAAKRSLLRLLSCSNVFFFNLNNIIGETKHRLFFFIFNSLLYTSYTYSSKHRRVTHRNNSRFPPGRRRRRDSVRSRRTGLNRTGPTSPGGRGSFGSATRLRPQFPATGGYTSSCKDKKGLAKSNQLRMEPNQEVDGDEREN